jgi:ribonuclease E
MTASVGSEQPIQADLLTTPGEESTTDTAGEPRRRRRRGGRNRNRRDRDQVDGNQAENVGIAEQGSHGHTDHFESNTVEVVQHFIEHTSEPHVSYPTETPVSAAATYSPSPTFASEAATAHAPAPSVTAEAPAVEPKYTHVDSHKHTHSNTNTHHEHDHNHDHNHDDHHEHHDHHHAHAESSIVETVPTPAPAFVPTPVAVTPAPAPTPAPVPAPAVSQQSLDEVLKSAGLTMAVTNPDKLRQVQEASAVSAPPVRTPRERKPVVSAPSEPLVQIETQR